MGQGANAGGRFGEFVYLIVLTAGLVLLPRLSLCARTASNQATDTKRSAVYQPGGDVKSPKLVHYVEPEFASTSEKAFVDGTVKVMTVVTDQGVPTEVRVVEGLNEQEDKAAVEAVKQWKFKPGTKAGQPVNVRVTVQIVFHLL